MRKAEHFFFSTLPTVIESLVFLALTVVQYYAYYCGVNFLLKGHFDPMIPVALTFLTYMFRLDFIAAIIGFYGAWKVWNWPVEGALLISGLFIILSFTINYGIRTGLRKRVFRRLWGDRLITKSEVRAKAKRERK